MNNDLPSCPIDFQEYFNILYNNGFGFQPPGGVKDRFILAWISEDLSEERIKKLNDLANTKTVLCGDYLGYNYISIHWTEFEEKHRDTLTSLLKMGISFTTQNKLEVRFTPDDEVYTPASMEIKFIKKFTDTWEELQTRFGNMEQFMNIIYYRSCYVILKIWNYETLNGENFCNYLRASLNKKEASYDKKSNYWKWPSFQNFKY